MLSVIICTYNRDKYIYNVLKSLAENNFPTSEYEIVLVNNISTDNTEIECKNFENDYPCVSFNYVIEKNQGLSFARNRGIKESKGDILIYVDDDALVNKKYIQTYADFFAAYPQIQAAGGPIIPKYEGEIPKWMSRFTKNLVTGYLYLGDTIKPFKNGKYPGGGNAAYRKEVFEKTGLFNTALGRKKNSLIGAEEKDLFDRMNRLNMKFYYLPNAILYHLIPVKKTTKAYFEKLTYSIGQSERMRTLSVSKTKYGKRLLSECVKWAASIVLFIGYTFTLRFAKGWKLLEFRWYLSKGLLQKGKE